MKKSEIKAFFDSLAPEWDSNQKRNEEIIDFILAKGGVKKGSRVLDIASGTGVLFEDYLRLGVSSLTGIDISEKMLEIAKKKFPEVSLILGDAESYSFSEKYDVIMIYNAFPHFPEPIKLFENLSKTLAAGGRLTVAHGISMAEIEKCHSGKASKYSLSLPSAEILAEMMTPFVKVDIVISDENMYMVSGVSADA